MPGRDGILRHYEGLGVPEKDQFGSVLTVLTIVRDTTAEFEATERLRASEARLRESEARFSAAFQASPAFLGIMRMSDEKYVLANDAYLNWLGYSREEVLETHALRPSLADAASMASICSRIATMRGSPSTPRVRSGETSIASPISTTAPNAGSLVKPA